MMLVEIQYIIEMVILVLIISLQDKIYFTKVNIFYKS
jgi:hypothetical protein